MFRFPSTWSRLSALLLLPWGRPLLRNHLPLEMGLAGGVETYAEESGFF